MVEKIDRPDARPPYEIREAKQTKEDQHHQQNQREEAEKHYKKQLEGDQKEWSKFGRRSTVIKPVKVACDRIEKIIFRAINLFKGVGILHVDVLWKDGRKTEGALIRVGRMEDFLRLKRLSVGAEVPRDFWTRRPTLELGILQEISSSGPFPSQEGREEKKGETKRDDTAFLNMMASIGIANRNTGRMNWGMVAFYLFILTVVGFALYWELR